MQQNIYKLNKPRNIKENLALSKVTIKTPWNENIFASIQSAEDMGKSCEGHSIVRGNHYCNSSEVQIVKLVSENSERKKFKYLKCCYYFEQTGLVSNINTNLHITIKVALTSIYQN